jgi:hypothetical protein
VLPEDGQRRQVRRFGQWLLAAVLVKGDQAVPVPVHGSRDIGAGLLAALQHQSGVKLK